VAYLYFQKLVTKAVVASMCALACMAVPVRAGDGSVAGTIGPNIVISSLAYDNIRNWGSEYPGIVLCTDSNDLACTAAFSIGTLSCNLGDETALWIANTNEHPVIRQAIYRLLDGRFEQLGTSWVKHGFLAVNDVGPCAPTCVNPGTAAGGNNLRPGCADPYNSTLNGNRNFLGPASEINAFTGMYPYPPILQTGAGNIANRVQVAHADLDRGLNNGARYFAEGHYVTADDAQAGNGEDNAAYKEIDVFVDGDVMGGFTSCITPYCVWDVGSTFTGDPAIRAWGNTDPGVRMTDARVPAEGLFILGAKVTDLGTGFWKYEYALANLNSDRSGASFEVPIPDGAIVTNIGFHDVNYHSGEPWDGTDWTAVVSGQTLTWSTTSYDVDPNANALRWSTLYNFRFEVNAPPEDSSVVLGLFKPGLPATVAIRTDAPRLALVDCNENGIADHCDVSCDGLGCDQATCGTFDDCNANGVPDDPMCEADCNANGIPDSCDLADCLGELWCGDCNGNTAPDICDADCNGDGVPNDCEAITDTDGDGIDDCDDLCPFTTPVDECLPEENVLCRSLNNPGLCFPTTRTNCIIQGGEPVCGDPVDCVFLPLCPDSQCRDGCLVGDYDKDGDIDFADIGFMQMCFSGDVSSIKYELPTVECLLRFDFDLDDDVDLDDYFELMGLLAGP
jgi:hypothetical protein